MQIYLKATLLCQVKEKPKFILNKTFPGLGTKLGHNACYIALRQH